MTPVRSYGCTVEVEWDDIEDRRPGLEVRHPPPDWCLRWCEYITGLGPSSYADYARHIGYVEVDLYVGEDEP